MNVISAYLKARGAPICPLSINGTPLPIVLHNINARRGLPMAKKARRNQEGDRAKAKALMRQRAQEDANEQRAYETAFGAKLGWTWRRVEKELRQRKMVWAELGIMAASLGIIIEPLLRAA